MKLTHTGSLLWSAGITAALLIIIIALQCLLPTLLRQAVNRQIRHLEQSQQVDIRTCHMRFTRCSLKGTFHFQADSISIHKLQSPQNELILQGVSADIRAWKGLKKAIAVQHIQLHELLMLIPETHDSTASPGHTPARHTPHPAWNRLLHQLCQISKDNIHIHHITILYHRLHVQLSQIQLQCLPAHDSCHYTLQACADCLQCGHHYLSPVPVSIDSLHLLWHITATPQYIEADSCSTLQCHNLSLHPYIHLSYCPQPRLVFIMNEPDIDAAAFFAALPAKQFQILPLLQPAGHFSFYTLLHADMNNIDSLKFTFNLHSGQPHFHITQGLENITRFNEDFEYPFYINGELIRNISIGTANPLFCPFSRIPPYLRNAILASEDAAFFRHRGFITSSIQDALITDIKSGRLRRGGSTISMQLVKNLYLNRKKIFTRKLEEILLVWMIEEQHLMSKERMFEIYVNIIEWGPNIVGIGEAAEFYFHKSPADLTQAECIYLATLIRAPKHYASTLQPNGTITEARQNELLYVARHMLERELMTETEYQNFNPVVNTVITQETEN